jgi:hypothetical protein
VNVSNAHNGTRRLLVILENAAVMPNPSVNLTRYGRRCKPGLSHSTIVSVRAYSTCLRGQVTYPIRGSRMNLGARFKTFGLGLRVASKFLATSPQALRPGASRCNVRHLSGFPRHGITCLGSRATDTMAHMPQRQRPNHQAPGLRAPERARPAASAGRTSRSVLSMNFGARCSMRRLTGARRKAISSSVTLPVHAAVMPNPSVERTHNGMAPRCTHVHSAHRGAMPLRSAHLERWASRIPSAGLA